MIAKLPRLAARILLVLARHDDGLSAADLAGHIYPAPKHPPLTGTYAEKLDGRRLWLAERAKALQRHEGRVSVVLRRLTRSGLVNPLGPPRPADWAIRKLAAATGVAGDEAERAAKILRILPAEARLFVRLVTTQPPTRTALGLSGRGARVLSALTERGVVISSAPRSISAAGLAMVEKLKGGGGNV